MPLDLPLPAAAQGHLRRLNTQRDLESVANLVELCFDDTLDAEGRTYLRNMRESARSAQWTGWVNSLAEYSPTPPSGLVWEENGQLVGNLSLIPIICRGQRCYLIANVAVHPDHRGRGIGRTPTATAASSAAARTALPQLHVTWDPTVCHSYAFRSVSGVSTRTFSTGTHSTSATTCAITVKKPCPISIPETAKFSEPSSLNFK